jgi:hypothetical protein
MPIRRLAPIVVALATALAACGDGTDPDAVRDPAAEMLANLPDCDQVDIGEQPEVPADVDGLVLPAGSRVTSVLEQGPLTTVEGRVQMTPLELRAEYESREDIDLLRAEDETFEAEVLLRSEGRRMYLRAVALCADGTGLTAVIGPDRDDAGLPEFQGNQ